MKQKKPSKEYLDFLIKYKEYEQNFLLENNLIHKYKNMQDFIEDKMQTYLNIIIEAGYTEKEIEKHFQGFRYLIKN